jgi:hypothetical protein
MRIMNIQREIAAIETRLEAADISINDFCASVGIHRSNWQRWKAGVTAPNMRNWGRVLDAVPQEAA